MTQQRKADHIRINLEEDVRFLDLSTGLDKLHFVHHALPELALEDVKMGVHLFGRNLASPLLISSMTGGTAQSQTINRNLAEAAQVMKVAMGVGSQRTGIENCEMLKTFRIRSIAPDILLFGNLGAVQLNYGYGVEQCRRAVEMIDADALILHLNPLQEVLQPEGDTNWRNLLFKIEQICHKLEKPVVVKEVGWGISDRVAKMLIEAGVCAIDVAGAGGTSWSQVEMHRAATHHLRRLAGAFRNWGIPTAHSLRIVRQLYDNLQRSDLAVFASGGIRTGQEIAKCMALGADLVGLAAPFLKPAIVSAEAVIEEIQFFTDELRIVMFCIGAANLTALRASNVFIHCGETFCGDEVPLIG